MECPFDDEAVNFQKAEELAMNLSNANVAVIVEITFRRQSED